ncbi:MAG: LruC domain-containing protein [uncultured Thiotrichaceae bacterium]|uniref:LruC domain-containing protein n=1 Tax=uncultured Thiotrichaceae bacterium TaxID=298394 RepID=A0A6S6S9Y3_9GAMM|nr:MAG: LruC domain-containing protein [uncultured Thiotrichaceae bacterium]
MKNSSLSILLTAVLSYFLVLPQAHAISIVLDGNFSAEDAGNNMCQKDSAYRFGTNAVYEEDQLDILVKILDQELMKTTGCIEYDSGTMAFRFDSGGSDPKDVFADIEVVVVKKGTTTPINVDNLIATFSDLDHWRTNNPDSVYLKDHVNVIRNTPESKVKYDATKQLTSSIGIEYNGLISGNQQSCNSNTSIAIPECKASVTWTNTSKFNIRLATKKAFNSHYFISLDIENASSLSLGDDHGDAPISYGDAFHTITPLVTIGSGATPDFEKDTNYSANADGDDIDSKEKSDYDDEDGVHSFPALADGYTEYKVDISASNYSGKPAKLYGWIDFNNNGFFESSEATWVDVPANSGTATYQLEWNIISNIAEGIIYSRFRISTDTALNGSTASGYLQDGEVEDYNLTASAAQPFACNADSYVFVSDAADSPTFANIIDLANGDSKSANEGLSFHPTNINATGYNLKDGYIWGYDLGNEKVVRIDSDYIVETFTVPGLPAEGFHVGDVSPDGIYYLASQNFGGSEIYKVDANPLSPTYLSYLGKIDLSPVQYSNLIADEHVADFGLHPFDNHLYFIGVRDWGLGNQGILYKTNVQTGMVTEIGDIGFRLSINPNTTWFDMQGNMYFNDGNNVYQIDLSDPANPDPKANLYSTVMVPSYGDAARCSRAPISNFEYDFGDAPDTYGTDNIPGNSSTSADSVGPKHIISNLINLGSIAPDTDTDGHASSDALGDNNDQFNDEDGISAFPSLYVNATAYSIPASNITLRNVTGTTAILYAYIDLNRDGDFLDPGEATNTFVPDGATAPASDLVWGNLNGLTEGITFARFRLSTDTTLTPNGGANNGEVEDYTLTIEAAPSCSGFSGDVNAGISPISQLREGEKIFLATNTLSPSEGHLTAYTLDADALPYTKVWDANGTMIVKEREERLYSTSTDGSKMLFMNLDDLAFNYIGLPSVATIKNYTMEPSLGDTNQYLGTRREDSFLGQISPEASLALIGNDIDIERYLDSATYRDYHDRIVSRRSGKDDGDNNPKQVLVTSDDGFLYSFRQRDGELAWGWMPRSLIAELSDYSNFASSHFMKGKLDVIDLPDANGSFASYVIGSYRSGLGQFVLKLSDTGSLESIVWDIDHKSQNQLSNSAPNLGQRAYFSDGTGTVYMIYIITDISGNSTLHIRNILDTTDAREILLSYEATATPFITRDFKNTNAPDANILYLGDSRGKFYAASLLDDKGILRSADDILGDIGSTAIGTIDGAIVTLTNTVRMESVASAITFIGASASNSRKSYYLRVQSEDRLTTFIFNSTNQTWSPNWTSYTGGSGKWLAGSSAPAADSSITSLPGNATITDSAFIVADSIVLPVSLPPAGNSCFGTAYYYFYKLTDGYFPNSTFYDATTSTAITKEVSLGYGDAKSLLLANMPGKEKLSGLGIAEQGANNSTGINKSMHINDPFSASIRSWREIR